MKLVDSRRSGVFLPLASLPGVWSAGRADDAARWFIDSLVTSGQSYWQVLPLNPMDDYDCPYTSTCASALDPLYVDPRWLVRHNLIAASYLSSRIHDHQGPKVSYWRAREENQLLITEAYQAFCQLPVNHLLRQEMESFAQQKQNWLKDFELFQILSKKFNSHRWQQWPKEYAEHQDAALSKLTQEESVALQFERFGQFVAEKSWQGIKDYANQRGLKLIGDIPIYVSLHSSDVWAHQDQFDLDEQGQPMRVSGVPPDQMCLEGQKWGHPLYDWQKMQADGYRYWLNKISRMLELYDVVRLDHFIGFCRYFAIPINENADKGQWCQGPGQEFFKQVQKIFPQMPFIAEDLGSTNADVFKLRDEFEIPGMGVFIFGFDEQDRTHHPSQIKRHLVYYSSTHDTQTLAGWLLNRGDEKELDNQLAAALQLISSSDACLSLFPVQDLLGQGDESRINVPGTASGNWTYRLQREKWGQDAQTLLRELTQHSGREKV